MTATRRSSRNGRSSGSAMTARSCRCRTRNLRRSVARVSRTPKSRANATHAAQVTSPQSRCKDGDRSGSRIGQAKAARNASAAPNSGHSTACSQRRKRVGAADASSSPITAALCHRRDHHRRTCPTRSGFPQPRTQRRSHPELYARPRQIRPAACRRWRLECRPRGSPCRPARRARC